MHGNLPMNVFSEGRALDAFLAHQNHQSKDGVF
jgi:hypothetical protein